MEDRWEKEKQLQEAIKKIKVSREMGERYMMFEELLENERVKTVRSALIRILEHKGAVPECLYEILQKEWEFDTLNCYFDIALETNSVESFLEQIKKL